MSKHVKNSTKSEASKIRMEKRMIMNAALHQEKVNNGGLGRRERRRIASGVRKTD